MTDYRKVVVVSLFLIAALCVAANSRAQQDEQWVLEQSTLTYHVSHPLHQVEGVSRAARGKGVCHQGQCDFLIAAPVKSFDSGDSNRDLHMQQVTKAGQFPIVTVRTQLPESLEGAAMIDADLQVQFAGQTAEYKQVVLQQTVHGDEVHITGTIPTKVSDFKIDPPSLFTIAIKNDVPVTVDMTWKKEK